MKANAVPKNPGCPSATENRVPSWPAMESCMTLPEVSSMCQSATTPDGVDPGCTTVVALEVATPEPAELPAVTTSCTVLPTSGDPRT